MVLHDERVFRLLDAIALVHGGRVLTLRGGFGGAAGHGSDAQRQEKMNRFHGKPRAPRACEVMCAALCHIPATTPVASHDHRAVTGQARSSRSPRCPAPSAPRATDR